MADLFPRRWLNRGVNPDKLSREVIDTDRWDREDRERMLKEVASFAASRKKLAAFNKLGEPAMSDTFAVLLKAIPELMDEGKIRPSSLPLMRIMEMAQDLDATDRLRRYTVNDDVQAALSCETMEPELETLLDMTEQQQKRAEQFEQALRALAQANQDQIDLDELVAKWSEENGLEDGVEDPCPTCGGTGQVPDEQDGQDGSQEGEQAAGGDGEAGGAEGEGQPGDGQPGASKTCPTCQGSGQGDGQGPCHGEGQSDQPGKPGQSKRPQQGGKSSNQPNPGGRGRGTTLTPEQRKQMEDWAKQQQELQERIEQLRIDAAAAGESFDDAMDAQKAQIRAHVSRMMDHAADDAQLANETAMTWGMEPGELQRLPAEERMQLAKRLNNDRFRRVAQLFGPMRNMMLSEQQRKTVKVPEEVFDVELGNDIGRLLPQEIMNLRAGPTRLDFMRRYTEGKLLQYALQGKEKLAKGAIIFCEDGSGSMAGEREMWAKAVMLCLLHLSRIQKRAMHIIHFSGPGSFHHIGFESPADYTLDRILDAAELFYGGGTDFKTPMEQALKLLTAEHAATGKVTADVVFVTDDECWVTEDFMEHYLGEMHRMQSTTWGISVSGADRREGALDTMSEGKVATIKDFLTGDDIRGIFRGV